MKPLIWFLSGFIAAFGLSLATFWWTCVKGIEPAQISSDPEEDITGAGA